MNDVSKIVECFIHETYLASLSEEELMLHLEFFSDVCGKAIAETVKDSLILVKLNNKLSLIRASQLAENSQIEKDLHDGILDGEDNVLLRARQIIKNKELILDAIEQVAPSTAEIIKEEINPESRKVKNRKKQQFLKRLHLNSSEPIKKIETSSTKNKSGVESGSQSARAYMGKSLPLLVVSSTLLFAVFFLGTLLIAGGF